MGIKLKKPDLIYILVFEVQDTVFMTDGFDEDV